MQKTVALFALSAALAAPAYAADSYTIDSRHTFPSFEINHFGFSTQHGYFERARGKITLDQAAKTGSVELTIDSNSLHLGFPDWTKEIATSESFFNAEKFPTMSYKSDKLVFDGDKVVAAEGRFTLLGVTKPLTLKVNNFRCAPNPFTKKAMCGADISATFKRSEFGMVKNIPAVSDEVKISSPVEAYKD
jgi:polyisoprenoid-binding protein YceI